MTIELKQNPRVAGVNFTGLKKSEVEDLEPKIAISKGTQITKDLIDRSEQTIKKYLGNNFEVVASMGHIRDLPKSKLGVNVENNFEQLDGNVINTKNVDIGNLNNNGDIINKNDELIAKAHYLQYYQIPMSPESEGEAGIEENKVITEGEIESTKKVTLLKSDLNMENFK